jgi:hypothetical protein
MSAGMLVKVQEAQVSFFASILCGMELRLACSLAQAPLLPQQRKRIARCSGQAQPQPLGLLLSRIQHLMER